MRREMNEQEQAATKKLMDAEKRLQDILSDDAYIDDIMKAYWEVHECERAVLALQVRKVQSS
jgi:hypothetical protein